MWYVNRKGKRLGPISQDDLVAHIKNGKIKGSDLVWTEGMSDWSSAKDVNSFRPLFSVFPPELPLMKMRIDELDILDEEKVPSVAERPRNKRLASFDKFCTACGELLHKHAVICPKCGVGQARSNNNFISNKATPSRTATIIFALFLGGFGIHRFYIGHQGVGICYLLVTVFSGFLLWPIIILINIVEAIVWACMSEDEWELHFGPKGV